MKIVVVEPFKNPYVAEINGSLESFQKVVGGYIEVIYPFNDCRSFRLNFIYRRCTDRFVKAFTVNYTLSGKSTGTFSVIFFLTKHNFFHLIVILT